MTLEENLKYLTLIGSERTRVINAKGRKGHSYILMHIYKKKKPRAV